MTETLVRIAGSLQIGLVLAHAVLPTRLGWRADAARLSPGTRRVFWTHAGCLLLLVAMIGALSALAPRALLGSGHLSAMVCGGVTVFWGSRATLSALLGARDLAAHRTRSGFQELVFSAFCALIAGVYGLAWAGLPAA